jgi:hypothetical protein
MALAATAKADPVVLGAAETARTALLEVAEPDTVGDHLDATMLGERLAVHRFACTSSAYVGWEWTVSVTRASRQKVATVCESALVPGEGALLSPRWVPYADRLAPGDLRPSDVLPFQDDDPRLVQGFEATGEDDVDELGFVELGLGRRRVLSREGREAAAQRWYDGPNGPASDMAVRASARCSTCGYFLPMAGALRAAFGVCANEWSPADGRVVALGYGCGAHSETDVPAPRPIPVPEPLVDELSVEPL